MTTLSPTVSDPEWYLRFGFDRDPFAEGGVHGLFYPGGARQETVEQLQHLARYSDCVLLVTGAPGSGKSATRRHFVAQAGADTRCCVVEAALLDGPEQWLRRVLAGFGIRPSTRPEFEADLALLAEFCAGRGAGAMRTWLVIDDGQDLHEDVTGILARLLEVTGRNLRLVFFAEPRWREVLQSALAPGVALHTLELQPFEPGETHAYVHYRLNTAGLDGEPPFSPQEFERIHRESGGFPGRINAVARDVLREAVTEVEQPLNALPLWHFAVIAATLLALLLLYAWGSLDQDAHPAAQPEPGAVATDAAAGGVDDVPSIQIAPAEPAPAVDEAPAARGEALTLPAPTPGIELASEERDEASGGLQAQGDTDASTPAAEPAAEPARQSAEPSRETADRLVTAGAPAAGPTTVPASTPAVAANATPPAAQPAQSAAAPKPAAAVPKPPAAQAAPAQEEYVYRAGVRAGGAPTADEQYLLGLDPGRYVLQIMGSDDAGRVRAFAARSGLSVHVYRKLHNGREWYALVHGEYPSRAAAETAVGKLPPRLRDSRPWVRRLDAVQKEIRAARGM